MLGRVLSDQKRDPPKLFINRFSKTNDSCVLPRNRITRSCTIDFKPWADVVVWPFQQGAHTQQRVPQRAPSNMHREPQNTCTSLKPGRCSATHTRLCLSQIGSVFESNSLLVKWGIYSLERTSSALWTLGRIKAMATRNITTEQDPWADSYGHSKLAFEKWF